MSQPLPPFDKSKNNYLQRCFYVINLLKNKDYDLWENFNAQYSCTKPEESWELFQMVIEEYRKLSAPVTKIKAVRKKAMAKPIARKIPTRKAA